MASGLDAIRDQLKKIGAVDLAIVGAALTSTENKFKAIAKAVKDIAIDRLIPITASLAGALVGVRSIIRDIVKDSGSLEAAFNRMAKMRGFQNQLEPLLKSAQAARQRIAELVKAASGSGFNSSQWVAGSRAMEILSRGAMGGAASLQMAARAARATGGSLDGTAYSIAELYRNLQDGQPIAQAGAELQRMGLISAQTVREVSALEEGGAAFATVWGEVEKSIRANSAAVDDFAQSAEGLAQRLESAEDAMRAAFGQHFIAAEQAAMEDTIATAQNLVPVFDQVGKTLAGVVSLGDHLGSAFTRLLTSIPGLATAAGVLTKGFVVLGTVITALGISQLAARMLVLGRAMFSTAAGFNAVAAASNLLTRAEAARAAATAAAAAGSTVAAAANNALAFSLEKAAVGTAHLTLAGGGLRAMLTTLAFNPFTAILAAIGVLAAAWQDFEEKASAEGALAQIIRDNKQAEESLRAHTAAVRSLEDAYEALARTTASVKEAQSAAANRDTSGDQRGFFGTLIDKGLGAVGALDNTGFIGQGARAWLGNRNATTAANRAQGDEMQRTIVQRAQEAQRVQARIASGELVTQGQDDVVRRQAARELALNQNEFRYRVGQATGRRRVDMLRGYATSEQAKADAGSGLEKARADYEAKVAGINAGTVGATAKQNAIDEAGRQSPSEIIRMEQQVRDLRKAGRIEEARALDQQLALRRQDIELNRAQHEANAQAARQELEQAERALNLQQIALDAVRDEAKLRSEGLLRAEQESAIRTRAAQLERNEAAARGDSTGVREADNRLAGERQRIEEIRRDAERSKRAAEREISSREAALRGDGDTVSRLDLEGKVENYLKEARGFTADPAAQRDYARRKASVDIREQLNRAAIEGMGVSSLARIGGGGNTYAGIDVLKENAKKQTDLLKIIAENTRPSGSSGELTLR